MALELRPYQADAIAAIEDAERRGVRRPLLGLPTGTGKTVIFAALIRRRGGRALVLAHRDELLMQATEKIRQVDPETRLGLVKAEANEVEAPVVVASMQTLARESRLARLPRQFQTVVVDEAHHATADSYRRVLDFHSFGQYRRLNHRLGPMFYLRMLHLIFNWMRDHRHRHRMLLRDHGRP